MTSLIYMLPKRYRLWWFTLFHNDSMEPGERIAALLRGSYKWSLRYRRLRRGGTWRTVRWGGYSRWRWCPVLQLRRSDGCLLLWGEFWLRYERTR